MITVIVTVITFLSTFFAIFHLVSSFKYHKEPVRVVERQLGFAILVPCYNEAPILENTLAGLLRLDYSNYEVVFVNDGSTDKTMEVLSKQLELVEYANAVHVPGQKGVYQSSKYPNIYVIDKLNSGKAASLNAAIAFCHMDLVVTLDGDCILERDALKVINQTFQDKDVIASGGVVHVMQHFLLNKKKKPIISLQTLDFIKGFYIYKSSLAYNNAMSIISGAFGVFCKKSLMAVGGFHNGLGEDIDITIRLQEYALNHHKKTTYSLGAVCYTECPETWRDLSRQRVRWQKAFIDALIQNRRFLFGNFFKSNICFFMLADAAFSGSMAVICFLCNLVLILLKSVYGFSALFLFVSLLAVLFNICCSLIAIYRAIKLTTDDFPNEGEFNSKTPHPKSNVNAWFVIQSIFMDLGWFSFLRVYYFLKGTIAFSLNHRSWDKVRRTSNSYQV